MKKIIFIVAIILACVVHETRAVIYTVTNNLDNNTATGANQGDLRYCINQALITAGAPHTINFNITPLAATYTINVGSVYNLNTSQLIINATSQPGWVSAPIVILNGGNTTTDAFQLNGGTHTIKGFVIQNFTQHGILANSGTSHSIIGNYIGTNAAGTVAAANGTQDQNHAGLFIQGATNVIITGNVISGNIGNGIRIQGNSAGSVIKGNFIGTNPTGLTAIPNTSGGIRIDGSNNHTIGGSTPADRNIISGNGGAVDGTGPNQYDVTLQCGIYFNNVLNSNISGNYIGVDATGLATSMAMGNVYCGVKIEGNSTGNTIGGINATFRNIIGGNGFKITTVGAKGYRGHGIQLKGAGVNTNTITANYVGVGIDGSTPLGNRQDGVSILGVQNNTIGGNTANLRNVICNNDWGVFIQSDFNGSQSSGNKILGNYIGTDATGTVAIGNGTRGIDVDEGGGVGIQHGSTGNFIGRDNAGEGNVISGNKVGVEFRQGGALGVPSANFVYNNYIGVDNTGNTALPNSGAGTTDPTYYGNGVVLGAGSTANTVGGTGLRKNIISGNNQNGVLADNTTANFIQGNYIGLNLAGTATVPNGQNGVSIVNASSTNTVGGATAGLANTISGNPLNGILISASTTNTIQGNFIGTNPAGTSAFANSQNGISIVSASNGNIIGGTTAGMGNTISGNTMNGISISASGTNTIQGNFVGTNSTGAGAVPNTLAGIAIANLSNANIIGGAAAGARNIISANTTSGIVIDNSDNTVIKGNSIGTAVNGTSNLGNTQQGILLGNGTNNTNIGGLLAGEGNIIAYNGINGITITDAGSFNNNINKNSIFCNVRRGIELNGVGNNNYAKPVITVTSTASVLVGTSPANAYIEIFTVGPAACKTCTGTLTNDSLQGKIYVATVQADASGNWTYNNGSAFASDVTVTASSNNTGNYNTSEFSFCRITCTNAVAPTSAATNLNNFCSNVGGNIILSATGGSGSVMEWFTGSCGGTSIGTTATTLTIPAPTVTTTYFVRWNSVGGGSCTNSTCVSVPVTVTAAPVVPTSASSNLNNFCSNVGGNITLSATGGSGLIMEWFTGSCGGTSLGTTATTLTIPAPTATTTYFVRWNGNGSCANSVCASAPVTVIPAPIAPTSGSSNLNNFCSNVGGNIILSATGGSGLIMEWFTGSCGGTSLGTTSTTLTIPAPTVTTTYYVRWNGAGTCANSTCASVPVTVTTAPIVPTSGSSNLNNFCSNVGGNIILSTTGGSGSIKEWFTGSCGGTSIGTTATSLSIPAPTVSTTYYVRWNGAGTCANSACVSVPVTVIPAPIAPTSGSSNLNNFCSNVGGNIILSAAGGGSGSVLEWFTGSCGGTSIGTTATTLSIPAPIVTTTYFVRWNGNGTCANSSCASVPVTVTPAPVAPTSGSSNNNNFCSNAGGNIILSANAGSGSTLEWFTGSCGGTSIGTTNTTLSIPSPTVSTTYYVRWNGAGTCANSTCVAVPVTVTPTPVAPTAGSSNLNNFCSNIGGNIVLSATSTGANIEWFTGSCGGTSLGIVLSSAGLTIPAPTVSTTYYVRTNGTGTCANSSCFAVPVTVTAAPIAPTSGSSNLDNFCSNVGGNIILSANGGGAGSVLEWFTGSCGGTSIGTTATTLSVSAPTVTTTYYVRWNGNGTCANSTCASFPVTVIPAPVAPTSGSSNLNNFCSNVGGNITLTATSTGTSIEWFTGSCGGTSLGIVAASAGLTIPAPTVTTTYYVRTNGTGSCANSTCFAVPVTVTPAPVTPTSGSSNINNFCSNVGGNIVLSATSTGTNIEWFTGSCGGTSLGVVAASAGLTIPAPTVTTTYYVRTNGAGSCANSICFAVPVTVTPAPVAPVSGSSNLNNFCSNAGGNIILSANGGGSGSVLEWFTGSCGGTSIGTTATTLSIPAPTSTTTYYVRWNGNGTCANSSCSPVPVIVTVATAPVAPISATSDQNGNSICSNTGGNIILSATGGSGSLMEWFTSSCGGTSLGTTATTLTIPAPTTTTTYYVRWNGAGSCTSSNCISVPVTVHQLPTDPTSPGTNRNGFCSNDAGTITLTASVGAGENLVWYANSCLGGTQVGTGPSLIVSSPSVNTSYFAKMESASCPSSNCVQVDIAVVPSPSPSIMGSLFTVCVNATNVNFSTASTLNNFTWSINNGASVSGPNNLNTVSVNLGTLDATITVTETNPVNSTCSGTDSKIITVNAPSGATAYAGPDRKICTDGVQLLADTSIGIWTVANSTGAERFSPNATKYNATVSGLSLGSDTLVWTVSGSCGYISSDKVIITVSVSDLQVKVQGPSDTACFGTERELDITSVSGGSGKYIFTWSSSDNSFNNITYNKNTGSIVKPQGVLTTYYVTVSDGQNLGCGAVDSAKVNAIEEQHLVIPNLITPNEDGKNDVWVLKDQFGNNILPGTFIEVTNRWGQFVYRNSDYNNSWEGKATADGVYYYYMKTGCGNKTLKGWLEIVSGGSN